MIASEKSTVNAVRLHFTNVVGLGAVRLAQSLLPALLQQREFKVENIYLPAIGELSSFPLPPHHAVVTRYRRALPNIVSRLLECTVLGGKFNGNSPLLVFGDLPIRCKGDQTVFVQTGLILKGQDSARLLGAVKYMIARAVFRMNQRYAKSFIVQTEWMRRALIESYPALEGRVQVISQPPPVWLAAAGIGRSAPALPRRGGLKLFYPAASYPHKNHKLLAEIRDSENWPVAEFVLTLPPRQHPAPAVSWVHCVGHLQTDAVIEIYRTADALLFLSLAESFGFPLIEAMSVGIPVVCPDLPYARALCGDEAIYFDPYSLRSLKQAINTLERKLDSGWWPDWTERLKAFPKDWNEVAARMLRLTSRES
jgi:glycosyltransferase involved in cell wall biosynthesis